MKGLSRFGCGKATIGSVKGPGAMHKNDNFALDCQPTASGILLCLRMLTEEAVSLNLRRAVLALRAASLVVEAEASDFEAVAQVGLRVAAMADAQVR
jgi:hypothetical protein